MLADQAAGILARAAGFGTEAGAVGAVPQRQVVAVQDFIPVQVGNRHFRRGNQVHVHALQLEHVFREFRQLAGTLHAVGIYDKGREKFRIPMLGGMQVQIEIDDGPFQTGTQTFVHRKPGAGNFMAPFKIQNPQFLADIPVGQRFKIKLAGFAPFPNFRIIRIALADRAVIRRHVGNRQHDFLQAGFNFTEAGIVRRNFITDGAHFRHFFFRAFAGFFQFADFLGSRIPFILQHFYLLGHLPAFLIQRQKLIQIQFPVTVMNGFNYFFGIFPHKLHV